MIPPPHPVPFLSVSARAAGSGPRSEPTEYAAPPRSPGARDAHRQPVIPDSRRRLERSIFAERELRRARDHGARDDELNGRR
jgi:hypothetical protein